MTDLQFQSATRQVCAILDRKISSVELLDFFKTRIEHFNPKINAVVATNFDDARQRAIEADEALANGETWGPLHGLPMTVKDSLETAGMPCTSGFPGLKDHFPEQNADVVESMVQAGAIVFGKSNLPLFGQDFQSFNDVYGQTNNPWDETKVPGGSSGGSAAALCAGLTGLEMGSDIGGSIRNPAHFCGVYGHKPSYGIVSFKGHIPPYPGLFPGEYTMSGDIAVIGPLARSAEDLALVMDIITKPQPPLETAWRLELPSPRKKILKEFRVGIWLDDPDFPVDSLVADCLQNLVDALSKKCVMITDKKPDIRFTECHDIYTRLLTAVPNSGLTKDILAHFHEEAPKLSDADKSFRAQLIRGSTMLHRDWLFLDYMRLVMRQKWADYFRDVDVLLCPAAPVTAFAHDSTDFFTRSLYVNGKKQSYYDTLSAWAGLTCVSYLPATVAPAGPAKNGLPVGVQIVGPYLEDKTPIHFAGLIEEITGGFRPPPGYRTGILKQGALNQSRYQSMKTENRSRTAEMAAVIRGLHLAYESPVVFNDPFATRLAGPLWHCLCRSRLLYVLATRTIYKSLNPIRRQVVARARYAEDQLEQAVDSGIKQYVIIGAGLDSFALRQPGLSGRISIYELDHPATQRAKRKRLQQLGLFMPKAHTFVSIDFEKETIDDALANSNYSREHPAFFSWLGTVHYISKPAVFKTLRSIQSCAQSGSELVFDYAIDESRQGHQDNKTAKDLKKYTQRRGEPIISTFDPENFPGQVEALGFALMENLWPREQAERYFNVNDGQADIMPGSCFAHFRIL